MRRITLVFCLLALTLTGCTSLRSVPDHGGPVHAAVQVGDEIAITSRDGRLREFKVTAVSSDYIEGAGFKVATNDVVKLERREFSAVKTAGATAGTILVYCAVVVILFFTGL